MSSESHIGQLIGAASKDSSASPVMNWVMLDPALNKGAHGRVSRAQIAMALNLLLFHDLLGRVPTGAAYVTGEVAAGRKIMLDHGALRTIDGPCGALPGGYASFARILAPLGYAVGGLYPLPRLRMTGRAFVHQDFPEVIPQFFVSALHVNQLKAETQAAAARVFGASTDPLGALETAALADLARDGALGMAQAQAALPGIVRAFGRHHALPALADYEALLAESAEAAWIATEGNAFNHATTRVADVEVLAAALLEARQPLKASVEISANKRVRQTAFIADKVMRDFRLEDGAMTSRAVPGSFYEFISRDIDPATGMLDLTFDSGNATGIFSVTNAR